MTSPPLPWKQTTMTTVAPSNASAWPPCLEDYTQKEKTGSWILPYCPYVFMFVSAFGIAANCAVLVVFGGGRRIISRNPRILVLSQSGIDLCACVATCAKWATLRAPMRVTGDLVGSFLCHFWFSEYVIWVLIICSTLNLQLITVERFIALVFPMAERSAGKVKVACLCLYIYSLLHHWRVFIDVTRGDQPETETCCVYNVAIPVWQSRLFGVQNFAMTFAVPLVNMGICYSVMICSLRRKGIIISEESDARKLAASRILIKTFTIAAVAYVLCFTTNQISYLLHMFQLYDFNQKGLFYNVTLIMVNANMMVNPVIYFAFMPTYRAAVLKLLRLNHNCCSRDKIGGVTDVTGIAIARC